MANLMISNGPCGHRKTAAVPREPESNLPSGTVNMVRHQAPPHLKMVGAAAASSTATLSYSGTTTTSTPQNHFHAGVGNHLRVPSIPIPGLKTSAGK